MSRRMPDCRLLLAGVGSYMNSGGRIPVAALNKNPDRKAGYRHRANIEQLLGEASAHRLDDFDDAFRRFGTPPVLRNRRLTD